MVFLLRCVQRSGSRPQVSVTPAELPLPLTHTTNPMMFNLCVHKYNGHQSIVPYQHTTLMNQGHSTKQSKDK
jgi:hypothetical protein